MMDDFQFLYGNKTKADLSANVAVGVFTEDLTCLGEWDASTNTPQIIDGNGTDNTFYIVTVEGAQDLGNGEIEFKIGNIVEYNGDTNKYGIR